MLLFYTPFDAKYPCSAVCDPQGSDPLIVQIHVKKTSRDRAQKLLKNQRTMLHTLYSRVTWQKYDLKHNREIQYTCTFQTLKQAAKTKTGMSSMAVAR